MSIRHKVLITLRRDGIFITAERDEYNGKLIIYLHAYRGNLSLTSRRRPADGHSERLRPHERLQPSLPLLRYAVCVVDAGGRIPFGRGSGGRSGESCGYTPCAEVGTGVCRYIRHVVITGGEPMLFPDLVPLCAELRRREMHVTIETAGTRYLPVECDLMAVSPKLSNSTPLAAEAPEWIETHERNRAATDIVRRLNAEYDCQFKFVVGSMDDCDEVRTYSIRLARTRPPASLAHAAGHRMHQLAAIGEWLEPYCRENGLTFCPRRHIEWFGCCRGT